MTLLEARHNGTAASEIANPSATVTKTRPTVDVLTEVLTDETGHMRSRVGLLSHDVEETHQRSYLLEWQVATRSRGTASPQESLEQLADLGFAWRDIARLVNVSVPAVQKWRRGESASGENRLNLAAVLAACDLIVKHYEISQIASWFEMPLLQGVPVTPIDLWAAGRKELVFEHASQHSDPESTLTAFDTDWRETYRSDFEVYTDIDGKRSIRPKG